MQDSSELRQERALARRNWIGCLLTFAAAGIAIALISVVPLGLFGLKSQPTGVLVAVAIAGLGFTLLIGIGAVVLILRITHWSLEGARRQHQRGTDVLERTLPGVDRGPQAPPGGLAPRMLGKQIVGFLLFVFAISIGYLLVNIVINTLAPGTPGIITFALLFVLGALVFMLKPSLLNTRAATGQERPADQSRPLFAGILYTIIVIVPTLGVVLLFGYLPIPGLLLPLVVLGVCAAVFMTANVAYAIAPVFWIQAAVKECDYDGGLARARLAARYWFMPGFYRNLGGVILLWAGRYDEARAMFEQSIGESRREAMGAGSAALENVGCALAWQGKVDEAIPMFEGSIKIARDQVMVYSDLAEAYLQQGTNLSRVLELTDRAVQNAEHTGWETRLLARYQVGQVLATRAWALARAGRQPEAREMLERAFAKADKHFKPVLAGIYWRAGQVMLTLGDAGKAKEHFAQGKRIDPRGHYGRLCGEEMVSGLRSGI